jgi:hypothetical protein
VYGYADSKDDYLKRLRRVEGQVRGLQRSWTITLVTAWRTPSPRAETARPGWLVSARSH